MSARLYPAVVAVLATVVLAFVVLVPFVAVQHRRRGALRPAVVGVDLAVLVYALALASYTLLPLPTLTASDCAAGGAGVQLRPGQFLADVAREATGGPAGLLRDAALQQAVFNAALFVPLGVLVRGLLGRGVVTATVAGLGVSLLVEATQLTGVWFLFPCSYRLFDVDDLITNTAGALAGALVAPVVGLAPRRGAPDADRPRPVGAGRRLLGMLCDAVAGAVTGLVLGSAWSVVVTATGADVPADVDAAVRVALTSALPALVLLAWLLRTRRTVGEAAVRLRPAGRVSTPAVVVRWLLGIGGYLLLTSSTDAAASSLGGVLGVVSVVAVLITRGHRGLAYRVVGWDVQDDRHVPTSAGPDRERGNGRGAPAS